MLGDVRRKKQPADRGRGGDQRAEPEEMDHRPTGDVPQFNPIQRQIGVHGLISLGIGLTQRREEFWNRR